MISYFDTSLLIKLYLEEPQSKAARRMISPAALQPAISWLSEVEIAASLHGRHRRLGKGPTQDQLNRVYAVFREELSRGMYTVIPVDRTCFDLARSYAEKFGVSMPLRALDVLHVAAAVRGGAAAFGTFDERQRQLAVSVGLRLLA